jgi:hypothetical protein
MEIIWSGHLGAAGGRVPFSGLARSPSALGGVLLLTALQVLLDGITLPHAVRDIIFIFGSVVLGSILVLRDR